MLSPGPRGANHAAARTEPLNSYLPFSPDESALPMIPVVLGGFLGLYFFFRGCVQRPRKAPAPAVGNRRTQVENATATMPTTTTFTSRGKDTLTPDSHSEVIRLSPSAREPTDAPSMTQQGKITAALLKAGVCAPASWTASTDPAPVMVEVADPQTTDGAAPVSGMRLLDFKASTVLGKSTGTAPSRIPSSSQNASVHPVRWKPALLVWGGPVLTLACLYILAAHFGWL